MSLEGHPNNTTRKHLEILYNLGFRRVSYGVQDYNQKVQIAINRIQPFANVERVTKTARELGYTSVNHDLVFGLPFQTKENLLYNIDRTLELMPDRIALYSYAHVPWKKGNGQRGFKDSDLPGAITKQEMYQSGKEKLDQAGYIEVGMDHFALKTDSLTEAMFSGTLHRNFMGYTESKTQLMIGLGASAIGDSWVGFAQNEKTVEIYEKAISRGQLPIEQGYMLNSEDLIIRRHILNIMCKFQTEWDTDDTYLEFADTLADTLSEMVNDGMVEFMNSGSGLKVTEKGRPFVRNVCMAFDLHLKRHKPETQLFSMTI